MLRAGDKGKVEIQLTVVPLKLSIGTNPGGGAGGEGPYVEIDLSTLPTDTTPIDWASAKGDLQPSSVPDDAWDAIFTNFTTAVGATAGQMQSSFVADTAYLNQIGVENPTFAQVMAFAMLRADAALPIPTLVSDLDASFSTPGLSLGFGRSFFQSISGRYHLGTLGRG